MSQPSGLQAMHNLQLCIDTMAANIPGFPTLDYCAEELLSGTVSLWKLLDSLYETVRHQPRYRSAGRGRPRSRSGSPNGGAGEKSCQVELSSTKNCATHYCLFGPTSLSP